MNHGDLSTDLSTSVVVVGAGGHAKVVISTLQEARISVRAVYDDDPDKCGRSLLGVPIVGPISLFLPESHPSSAVIAIGDNGTRQALAERLADRCQWPVVIHPRAYVHPTVRLGGGTVVFAGAVIQPDVVVGPHSIVNTGASIDHDCYVGGFAHVAPGAHLAGGVSVGEGALIGVGSSILPGVCVGAWATVGAGAVVRKDVPPHATVVGVPARVVRG